MKNIFRTILSGLTLASLLVSCQKEMDTTTTVPVGEMVPVTFSAKVGAVTKVSLTPNGDETAFTSAWQNGDGMKLYYLNDQLDEGTVDATYDAVNNKWSATLPNYTGEWNYIASYPVASAIPFGPIRTQTGDTYNPAYDIMQGRVDVPSGNAGKDSNGNDIVFPMERFTAIQYFHFTSDLDEKVYKATLSVGNTDSDIAATTVDYSAGALSVTAGGSKSITLTFPVGSEPNARDFKLWFNVLPSAFTSMTIDIETASHTKHIERAIGGGIGEYEAGKLYKVSGKITSWTTKTKGSAYSWTLASGDFGTSANPSTSVSKGSPSLTWSTAFTWKASGYLSSADRGIHIGSGSNPVRELILSTSGYGQYVESIRINASRGSTAGPQISSITVDGTNLMYDTGSGSETSVALSTTATNYIFESPYLLKGDVVITFTNDADIALYIKSIEINPDDRTPVTLSFGNDAIEDQTTVSHTFTGQAVSSSPDVSAVTSNITWSITGDAITSSFNTSTGALVLSGAAGTATVTASFAGDENYKSANASYSITVSKVKLATPTSPVAAEKSGDDAIVVTLPTGVSNVGSYSVTCTGETTQVVASGTSSVTFSSLSDGSYTITVTAIPSDTSVYLDSDAWSSSTIVIGNVKTYTWSFPLGTVGGTTANSDIEDDSSLGATIGAYTSKGALNAGSWSHITNGSYFNLNSHFLIKIPISSSNTAFSISAENFGWKSSKYAEKTFTYSYYTSIKEDDISICSGNSSTSGCYSVDEDITIDAAYRGNGTLFIKIAATAGNDGFESLTVEVL